jgi:hypothetical protein
MSSDSSSNCYLILGHSKLVSGKSVNMINNNCLIVHKRCGEVSTYDETKLIYEAFFEHPDSIPADMKNNFNIFNQTFLGGNNSNFTMKDGKFHDQTSNLCLYWFLNRSNQMEPEPSANSILLMLKRSGIYQLNRGVTRPASVVVPIPRDKTNNLWMVSRKNMETIYDGSIFPSPEILDNIFGDQNKMEYSVFLSELDSKMEENHIQSLTEIMENFVPENSAIIMPTCRSTITGEIRLRNKSSDETFKQSQKMKKTKTSISNTTSIPKLTKKQQTEQIQTIQRQAAQREAILQMENMEKLKSLKKTTKKATGGKIKNKIKKKHKKSKKTKRRR